MEWGVILKLYRREFLPRDKLVYLFHMKYV